MATTNHFGFRSKTAAKENAKRILRDNEGCYGVPLTGVDAEFVTRILLNHPSFETKIGSGDNIEHHVVLPDGTNSRWGRGFRTKRRDTGRLVEWSYGTAIDGKHRDPRHEVETALRWEVDSWVKDQGDAYDRQFWPDEPQCYEFDGPIGFGEGDLHHEGDWPFRRIVYEFMRSPYVRARELGWGDIKLKKKAVGVWLLEDRELAEEWIRFHAELAQIVRVTKASHKKLNATDNARLAAAGFAKRGWDSYYGWQDFADTPYEGDLA
jgi:hypothetical protein